MGRSLLLSLLFFPLFLNIGGHIRHGWLSVQLCFRKSAPCSAGLGLKGFAQLECSFTSIFSQENTALPPSLAIHLQQNYNPLPSHHHFPQEAADGSGAIVSSRQGTATSLQNQPRIQKASSEMLLLKLSFCSCHFLTFLSRYYQALVFSCMPSQCLQHVLLASFIWPLAQYGSILFQICSDSQTRFSRSEAGGRSGAEWKGWWELHFRRPSFTWHREFFFSQTLKDHLVLINLIFVLETKT